MNFSTGPHHKIWPVPRRCRTPALEFGTSTRRSEEGYTLVALLALMTILALFAAAAAPSIRQQAQREREVEAIYRGEQVAAAIRHYYSYRTRSAPGVAGLPTSMDQLLEGIPSGTKKVQILRPSAARDPLSESGEWRLIKPLSNELADFQRAMILFAGNVRPVSSDPQLQQLERFTTFAVIPTLGLTSTGPNSSGPDTSTGPFIGASSRSKQDSIIYYYGISRHDQWIFTPLFR